ncbi:MAG: hypothetical protein M2R46_05599 [Verrucomicrobia subdivision 3 bacterium]|nr:hypothetical protein [Limisphaerales bacterium]
MKTDRPRRTGQGLKLTLAALLTALALQSDAAAVVVVGNLDPRSSGATLRGDGTAWATQFTVGPLPSDASPEHDSWALDMIESRFLGSSGLGFTPHKLRVSIQNDVPLDDGDSIPAPLDSPLAILTGPDPNTRGEHDFMPPEGTTVSLQPGSSYWLVYYFPGEEQYRHSFYSPAITLSDDEDAGSLPGWSIGDARRAAEASDDHEWFLPGGLAVTHVFRLSATPVPEPSEYALFFALGLGAFALWHRRRQRGQRAAA